MTFSSTLKILSVFDNFSKPVASLTSVGTTATATVTSGHGYQTGSNVVITGATPTAYNGNYTITVVSATVFTYAFAGGSSPASGTIVVGLQDVQQVLEERSFDYLRNRVLSSQPPQEYAISRMGANSVTIFLDCIPSSIFILSADAYERTTTLVGAAEPAFDENYHDILVHGGKILEYMKLEKPSLSKSAQGDFDKRTSELRLFIAKSAYLDIHQGGANTNPVRGNRV